MTEDKTAITASQTKPLFTALTIMKYLPKKPANGGMPAKDNIAKIRLMDSSLLLAINPANPSKMYLQLCSDD